MTELRIDAFAPPLQGAHRLASLCRYAGGSHAIRIPCFAPNPPPARGRELDSFLLKGGRLGWGWRVSITF